jgi:hypothetical protein
MRAVKVIIKHWHINPSTSNGKMKKTRIGIFFGMLAMVMLAGCPPPTEPKSEDYPGGGGYFPNGFTNFIHYQCLEDSYGSDNNYLESDEFGAYHEFNGVQCEDWLYYNYNADFNHYRVYKIIDESSDGEQGQVLCYGWETRNLDHSLVKSELYSIPTVLLDYPLSLNKTWAECNLTRVSPGNFNLEEDVDGDGFNDTIDLTITHSVVAIEIVNLPSIGNFEDCYKIEDHYQLHINYSDSTFPYPADYQFEGTSYYRPFIGWVKSALTTDMFNEERTITRQMYDYYVGGPTKQ